MAADTASAPATRHESRTKVTGLESEIRRRGSKALADQPHFLAMLMTYGTLEDTRWLLSNYPPEELRDALRQAPPGIFNGRSWHYWHLKLGLEPVRPLPKRRLPQ